MTTRVTPADGLPTRTALISGLCSVFSCSTSAMAVPVFGKSKKMRSGLLTRSPVKATSPVNSMVTRSPFGSGVRVIERTIVVC